MADVIGIPGLGEQLRLIVQVRRRMFVNGLRARSERLGLFGSIVLGVTYAIFSLGTGAGFAFGSFVLVEYRHPEYLSAILWGICLFWQMFPGLAVQIGATFDSRSLLRYPLRLSSYCALSLAQGLTEPSALTGTFWHACVWLGVVLARPEAWWSAGLTMALSVVMNVLLFQVLSTWTERLLAQRRTREIAVALFVLVMISLQFARFAVRASGPVRVFFHRTSAIWAALPPGQAGAAVQDASSGRSGGMLLAWCGLTGYVAVLGVLLVSRLRAEYLGESLSETTAPAAPATRPPVSAEYVPTHVWALLDGPVGAVFLKEVRYLFRNTLLAINLITPLIIAGAMSANMNLGGHGGHGVARWYAYPAVTAYAAFILLTRFSMSSLGLDGGGVQLFFLVPVPFRAIMLGKNLFQGFLLAIEAVLAWGVISLVSGPPPVAVLILSWLGLAIVALVSMSVGNWLSLKFPLKMEFGMRNRSGSGFPALVFMFAQMACLGVLAATAALGMATSNIWTVVATYVAMTAGTLVAYRAFLDSTSRLAVQQREAIIGRLVR